MAFDWIESHSGLRDHPKTIALAGEWGDRRSCVVGHLHELWWWTMAYAPDGVLHKSVQHLVPPACDWHGKTERFWSGLVAAGFLDPGSGSEYVVHDWSDYAGRLLERRRKDRQRKGPENAQNSSDPTPENGLNSGANGLENGQDSGPNSVVSSRAGARMIVPPTYTNLPDQPTGLVPVRNSPGAARAADVAPPRRAPPETPGTDEPASLRPTQQTCPLCPEVFPDNAALREHLDTSPRHKVRPVAEDLRQRRSSSNGLVVPATPAEVVAELEQMAQRPRPTPSELPPDLVAEHERLLAKERGSKPGFA